MTVYDAWWQVPEHLRTRTQLADLDLPRIPGGPAVASIETRNAIGRKDCFELYDLRASQPSPASAAALQAAAARRTRAVYRCEDCGAHPSSPAHPYRPAPQEPVRHLCRACLHVARLREFQALLAERRAEFAEAARQIVATNTAAILHTTVLTPAPGPSGRKKPAVAWAVTALLPDGTTLVQLAARLRRSRDPLVPVGALDLPDALTRLREVLAGRELVVWHRGLDLEPIAAALLPQAATASELACYQQHRRNITDLHWAAGWWHGEVDPDTRQLRAPEHPGRADRMALLLRRIAADPAAATGATMTGEGNIG